MATIPGKKLRLTFGGKKLYHATDCSLSISSDTEEIASKDTQGKQVIPGDYSYTLSTSALYAVLDAGVTATHITSDVLIRAQLDKTPIVWQFLSEEEDSEVYSGTAYVTQSDLNGPNGSIANTSFTLTGSGDIAHEPYEA